MPKFDLESYETVESRLVKFWADHPNGRVTTELVYHGASQFIVKAFLFREGEDVPFGTGLAEELVGSSMVNKTAALENCETSAIGRALANANYAAQGKRPSREEMSKVDRVLNAGPMGEESPRPQRHSKSIASGGGTDETRLATEKQRGMLRAKLKAKGYAAPMLPDDWVDVAGLPNAIDDLFPFDKVNPALEFIDKLEPVA